MYGNLVVLWEVVGVDLRVKGDLVEVREVVEVGHGRLCFG
jgi:hypothetical protein